MSKIFFKTFFCLLILVVPLFFVPVVLATYEKFSPGDTVTIGEFVYDDNFAATTTDCLISIYNPSHLLVVDQSLMSATSSGWHYYASSTIASTEGTWPAVMTCGTQGIDLAKLDKTFVVGYANASLSSQHAGWTVTLSDFGETTVNKAYQAKLQVLNYETTPTDADSLPTVIITDSVGTVQVPAGVMIRDQALAGTYSYSYTIAGASVGGVWETEVSVVVDGKTIKVNDYWVVSSSPADVEIISIAEHTGTSITANVEITNKGTAESDFYYVYCIVDSQDDLCGGDDDIDSGSDTNYIIAGQTKSLSLNLDVLSLGTYWFKVKARALGEVDWAGSSEQFIASAAPTPSCGDGSCNGSETCSSCPTDCGNCGGGGGGTAFLPTSVTTTWNSADFNHDKKVNPTDFSILLAFWKTAWPFKNPYVDINNDKQVNSIDFSILMYQWGTKK